MDQRLATGLGSQMVGCSTNHAARERKTVKRETNEDDGFKPAPLAMIRQLNWLHTANHQVREHRSLIKYHQKLTKRITVIRSTIRSRFVCWGIEMAKGQPAWDIRRDRINSIRKPLRMCDGRAIAW